MPGTADVERPIRVLVVDDHPVVRRGLVALLGSLEGFEVAAEASNGESAVREVLLTRPDVVLMDVQMPGLSGIEATKRLAVSAPEVPVLMLTMYDDDATVFTAMQVGARGYLLKGAEQDEIERALRAVVAGEAIFGPGVAARVLRYLGVPRASPQPDSPFPELTPESTTFSACWRLGAGTTPSLLRSICLRRRSATTSPPCSRSCR